MPIVTSLEPQLRNPKRFNVFLDGKFAFGADQDLIVNFRLLPGKSVNSEDLEKLAFESEVGKLMERMYGLFSIRMRSEREIRDYLRNLSFKRKRAEKEELSELVVELLIERLKQKQLIDDEIFARSWVEARRLSKQKGPQALRMELIQKGINREIVELVLAENNSLADQKKLAVQSLERKKSVFEKYDPKTTRKKSLDYLLRKGFDYNIAKAVVEQVLAIKIELDEESEIA